VIPSGFGLAAWDFLLNMKLLYFAEQNSKEDTLNLEAFRFLV